MCWEPAGLLKNMDFGPLAQNRQKMAPEIDPEFKLALPGK